MSVIITTQRVIMEIKLYEINVNELFLIQEQALLCNLLKFMNGTKQEQKGNRNGFKCSKMEPTTAKIHNFKE